MFETSKIFHRLRRDKARVVIAALLSFDVAVPPAIASDILIGRAVLPAATFAPGPTLGQQLGTAPINGQAVPFVDKQPVQGFSAVADNGDGSFMVMADNGYGAMKIRRTLTCGFIGFDRTSKLRRVVRARFRSKHLLSCMTQTRKSLSLSPIILAPSAS